MAANSLMQKVLVAALVVILLAGCQQRSPMLIKIGLVAPFEGRYREIGLDVIPAVRLAIREWAQQHPESDYAVELIAYDDAGSPLQAVEQAHKLVADPDIAIVIGHWRDDTTLAASEVYSESGIPFVTFTGADLSLDAPIYNLAPAVSSIDAAVQGWQSENNSDALTYLPPAQSSIMEAAEDGREASGLVVGDSTWGLNQFYSLIGSEADTFYFVSGFAMLEDMDRSYWAAARIQDFDTGFRAGSLDAPSGLFSVAAYEAAWVALAAIEAAYGIEAGAPNPSTEIQFDSDGRRIDAPIYLYQWVDGARQLIEPLP